MGVWFLKVAVVFIIVDPVLNEDDFFKLYRPNPSYPDELNTFFENVQSYKNDFSEIRQLAEREDKENDQSDFIADQINYRNRLHSDEGFNELNLNPRPGNNIYPYMYGKAEPSLDGRRFRRNPQEEIEIENLGESGEIHVNAAKFPGRFKVKRSVYNVRLNDAETEPTYPIELEENDEEGAVLDDNRTNYDEEEKKVPVDLATDYAEDDATPRVKIELIQPESGSPGFNINIKPTSVGNNESDNLKRLLDTNAKETIDYQAPILLDNNDPITPDVQLPTYQNDINNQKPVEIPIYQNDNNNQKPATQKIGLLKKHRQHPGKIIDNGRQNVRQRPNVKNRHSNKKWHQQKINQLGSKREGSPENTSAYPDMSHYWSVSEKQQIHQGIERAQNQESDDKAKIIAMALNLQLVDDSSTTPREKGFEDVESVTLVPRGQRKSQILDQFNKRPGTKLLQTKLVNPQAQGYSSIILEPKNQYPGGKMYTKMDVKDNAKAKEDESTKGTTEDGYEEDYKEQFETDGNADLQCGIEKTIPSDVQKDDVELNQMKNIKFEPLNPNLHLEDSPEILNINNLLSEGNNGNTISDMNVDGQNAYVNNLIQKTIHDVSTNVLRPLSTNYLADKKRFAPLPPRILRTHGVMVNVPKSENDNSIDNYDVILDDLQQAAKLFQYNHPNMKENFGRLKKDSNLVIEKPKHGSGINPRPRNKLRHETATDQNDLGSKKEDVYSARRLQTFQEQNYEDATVIDEILSPEYDIPNRSASPDRALALKPRAEGDYSDEEDSAKDRPKKVKAVKKTNNKFADPITQLGNIEDYLSDEIKKTSNDDYNVYDQNLSEFSHHGHKPTKENKNAKPPDAAPKYPKPVVIPGDSVFRTTAAWKHYQRNMANEREDADFQHWPKYVVDDMNKREQVKKRSVVRTARGNVSVSSDNNFFVGKTGGCGCGATSTSKSTACKTVSTCKGETKPSCSHTREMKMDTTSEYSGTLIPIFADEDDVDQSNPNKLDDFLCGDIGYKILHGVSESVENDMRLKRRFHVGTGPSRQSVDFCTTECPKPVTQQKPTEVMLAKRLLDSVGKILQAYINNFKVECVHSEDKCKQLTSGLKNFLSSILTVPKSDTPLTQIDDDNDEPSTQSAILFKLQNNGIILEEDKEEEVRKKISLLKQLLSKYNQLPAKCRMRAKPVKDYIDQHLELLDHLKSNFDSNEDKTDLGDVDKLATNGPEVESLVGQDPVERELESVGLGAKRANFQPNFNLDDILNAKATKAPHHAGNVEKRDTESDGRLPTKRFLKLFDAVRHLRQRRESHQKIAQLYAKERRRSVLENSKTKQDGVNFESPLVYSM